MRRTREPSESILNYYHEIITLCSQIESAMSETDKLRHIFRDKREYQLYYPVVCSTGNTSENFYHQVWRYEEMFKGKLRKNPEQSSEGHSIVSKNKYCLATSSISEELPNKKMCQRGEDGFVTKEELISIVERTVKTVAESMKSEMQKSCGLLHSSHS